MEACAAPSQEDVFTETKSEVETAPSSVNNDVVNKEVVSASSTEMAGASPTNQEAMPTAMDETPATSTEQHVKSKAKSARHTGWDSFLNKSGLGKLMGSKKKKEQSAGAEEANPDPQEKSPAASTDQEQTEETLAGKEGNTTTAKWTRTVSLKIPRKSSIETHFNRRSLKILWKGKRTSVDHSVRAPKDGEEKVAAADGKTSDKYRSKEKQTDEAAMTTDTKISKASQGDAVAQSDDSPLVSELRILLLGGKLEGKSSSGNTILGRKDFDLRTATQCVKRQGEVAGRQLTVIDTPGWWRRFPVENAELVKQEIEHSVSLCPPGPHTLILIIRLGLPFTEEHRRSVEEYLQLLTERVWSHTLVLFTHGDHLGDTTIEHYIETEGKALQWLVEKCGNRYHVLDNKNWGDGTQVTELLDKMEEMVAANRGGHYEMDREILEKMEEKEAEEERAQHWLEQREKVKDERALHLSELRVVLLGGRASGKSSSGNTILGRGDFDLTTADLCLKRQGEVAGKQVTVVDTPGWQRDLPVERTTELVKQEIICSVSLCPPGPHTLLLVIQLGSSFTEEERRSVEEHMKLFSERVWSHTILLFTYGDCLGDTTIKQHIVSEGKALQWLVEKCGYRYHVLCNENKDDVTQVTELLYKMEEMVAGNRGGHYEMDKIELWRRPIEEMAKRRKDKVIKQREIHRTLIGEQLSGLRVVLLGGRGNGKSSSGNTILGREEFDLRTAAHCVNRQGEVVGRQVAVVDTPGWWMHLPVEKTTELLKQEIVRSASLCPPGPHTFLLVIRLDLSFTEEVANSAFGHIELLGEGVWSHTIVLFTHGDYLGDRTIEQHIESGGKALQWLVEKCGNRYHVLNNKNRDDGTQVTELLDKLDEMVAANSGDVFHSEILTSEIRSINFLPLSTVSGESRAETGYGSELMSESGSVAGSLPRSESKEFVWGPRLTSVSSGSSDSSDISSKKEPKSSPHIRLNREHSWTSTRQKTTALMPELASQSPEKYRLQCPHAGVFKCSLTGLCFRMEGVGEVLYNTVQWDEDLLASTDQTPAGPLFSIDCPHGSVCQLYLPHCETLTGVPQSSKEVLLTLNGLEFEEIEGEGLGSLSVAHVSGDSVDLLPPLRVTDTHVVVNVTDMSLWGLVRRYIRFLTNWWQVLPFLESRSSQRSVLNLIVVPANDLLNKVEKRHKKSSYISVSSPYCTLTRGTTYSLCCDEVEKNRGRLLTQPENAEIYWSYDPNYHPTFQVFLSADTEEVELKLLEKEGKQVWATRVLLPARDASSMGDRQTDHAPSAAEKRLRSARTKFVKRVSKVVMDSLLDGLLQEKVINDDERESVKVEQERAERARAIIDMVLRKGARPCSVMMDLLVDVDPYLHSALGFNKTC